MNKLFRRNKQTGFTMLMYREFRKVLREFESDNPRMYKFYIQGFPDLYQEELLHMCDYISLQYFLGNVSKQEFKKIYLNLFLELVKTNKKNMKIDFKREYENLYKISQMYRRSE